MLMRLFGYCGVPLFFDKADDGAGSGDDDSKDDDDQKDDDSKGDEPSEAEKKLQAELDKRDKEIELLKKDRAGQTKKVDSLQKEMDDFKKAQMSEEERKAAEEEERKKASQEEHNKFLGECVTLAAERCELAEEDHFLLSGSSQDDIFAKGKRFKELLSEADQAGYDRAMKDKTKGREPGSGDPDGGGNPPKLGKTTLDSLNNLS